METYIFKIILSASILILLYYLFLEKERSFRFNRFYLLFALVFSYSVPFINLNFPKPQKTQTNLVFQEATSQVIIPGSTVDPSFNWELFLLITDSIITLFFILKSIFSIIKILKFKGKFIEIEDQKIKILEENLTPFSFFGTLYLGKNYFKNNKIDDRIFLHEKNHIEQKHSLDLLFIEVLIIFNWFNPILYFYKKAIITNHEFLADEDVIAQKFEIKPYQQLILDEISTYQNRNLTNQFNFNNTKKRFIMMTKPNSKFVTLKKIFALPIIALMLLLFAQKTYATKKLENFASKNEVVKSSKITEIPKKTTAKKLQKSDIIADIRQNYAGIVEKIENKNLPIVNKLPKIDTIKVAAEFPGGINLLRNFVSQNFDTSAISGSNKLLKTTVNFKIDENGNVTNTKAEGTDEKFNAEAEKAFLKVNEGKVWKPATEDGKAVKSVYKIPLTMQFAN